MPEVPVIKDFAKTPANDFYGFWWTWGNQNNLTIHTDGIRNPHGIKFNAREYQRWTSIDGIPISSENLAKLLNSLPAKFDNIEIILTNGARKTRMGASYAMELATALGGETNIMAYSSSRSKFQPLLRQALSDLPDAITGDAAALGKLAELPGWGAPLAEADGGTRISRIKGRKQLRYNTSEGSSMQPFHVRAGKRPLRFGEVASSMPKSARMDAASGAQGGRVAMGEMAEDAEEIIDVVGL